MAWKINKCKWCKEKYGQHIIIEGIVICKNKKHSWTEDVIWNSKKHQWEVSN